MKNLISVLKILISIFLFIGCQANKEVILFSSSRNGNADIYQMNAKGKQIKQLTKSEQEEWGPTWRTASTFTFLRQEENGIKRYQMDITSNIEKAIPQPETCILDDKNVVYNLKTGQQVYLCNQNLFLADAEGKSIKNLSLDLDGFSNYPSWHPDGKSILFTNNQEGNNEVYLLNLETNVLQNLSNHPANDERGDLSPDGTFLAFSSNRFNSSDQDILLLNLKTQELKNISNSEGLELIARWSKDGKRLYFGSNKDGNWEIYSYTLKSNKTRRLSKHPEFDGDPRVW